MFHFFKRIFDTSFRGKRDYLTKFTRPQFCLPFAQTVNRPFCPSTCIHGKQPANTNVVKSTTSNTKISGNAWVGEHFTLEGCVPEDTQHWKNLSNTSEFQAKPSKDNLKTHSLQFHDPRSFCAGLINSFVTVNFSNSIIIYKEKTKEIMSVWKSDEKLLIIASSILLLKSFCLRSNIKHSTQCFINRWNTSPPLRVVFSTFFSVFHLVMKHYVSCLIYYSKTFWASFDEPS